jgi:maleylpyruvate isomerase
MVTRPPDGAWCADGERFFGEALDRLPGAGPDGPSLLPGWSRRTVIAHVARNADALCNLLTWARTGVETTMYASAEAHEPAIAATAQLPLGALVEDCQSASRRFSAAVNGLPEAAWDVEVRTAQGRTDPVSQAPDARFSAGDRHWGTGKVVVTADLADLARYVTGRRVAAGDRPALPPWL